MEKKSEKKKKKQKDDAFEAMIFSIMQKSLKAALDAAMKDLSQYLIFK